MGNWHVGNWQMQAKSKTHVGTAGHFSQQWEAREGTGAARLGSRRCDGRRQLLHQRLWRGGSGSRPRPPLDSDVAGLAAVSDCGVPSVGVPSVGGCAVGGWLWLHLNTTMILPGCSWVTKMSAHPHAVRSRNVAISVWKFKIRSFRTSMFVTSAKFLLSVHAPLLGFESHVLPSPPQIPQLSSVAPPFRTPAQSMQASFPPHTPQLSLTTYERVIQIQHWNAAKITDEPAREGGETSTIGSTHAAVHAPVTSVAPRAIAAAVAALKASRCFERRGKPRLVAR